MARLSVNLNKIALLRNSRRTGVPDLLSFGRLALDPVAQGLTVHPRPDECHIRGSDVPAIGELMRPYRPGSNTTVIRLMPGRMPPRHDRKTVPSLIRPRKHRRRQA